MVHLLCKIAPLYVFKVSTFPSGSRDVPVELLDDEDLGNNKRQRVVESSMTGDGGPSGEGQSNEATEDQGAARTNEVGNKKEAFEGIELEVVVEEMPKWKILRVPSRFCSAMTRIFSFQDTTLWRISWNRVFQRVICKPVADY